MDETLKRLVASIVFFIVTSIVTFVLNNDVFGGLTSMLNPPTSGRSAPRGLTAHESEIAKNIVDPSSLHDTLESVGGLAEVKEDLHATLITPLKYPDVFFSGKARALHVQRGILFCGPPGCGKTLMARAIARECGNCTFLPITLSSIEDKYFGESSKKVRACMSLAVKMQPCIVFLDEVDGFLRRRTESDVACVYALKTELLSALDGFAARGDAVVVIAATNCSAALDPALRRRLPKQVSFHLPTLEEREGILRVHTKSEKLSEKQLHWLAEQTDGLSGSDLLEVYRAASALRLREHVSQPTFDTRAGAASKDPNALATLIRDMGKMSQKHWRDAVATVRDGKRNDDFVSDNSGATTNDAMTALRALASTVQNKTPDVDDEAPPA